MRDRECEECGSIIKGEEKKCPKCGRRQGRESDDITWPGSYKRYVKVKDMNDAQKLIEKRKKRLEKNNP